MIHHHGKHIYRRFRIDIGCLVLLLLLSLIFALPSFALKPIRTISGTVIKVSDGDTITVHTPEQTKLKVRLYGIDAPETEKVNSETGQVSKPGQPMGDESKTFLTSLVLDKTVNLDVLDIDKYHRLVCVVWLKTDNINLKMIKAGMAEAFVEYLNDQIYRQMFIGAEQEAKAGNLGIWSKENYVRPRDFRKRHSVSGG